MRTSPLIAIACLAGCEILFDDVGPGPGQPDFGTTVTRDVAPPPISGGTLTVLADGRHVVAADPDRDRIYVVDLAARAKIAEVSLAPGAEPGRVIEDGAGRVHVVLRSGGALVTIDPATWTITATRPVCPAPRGVAWERATDLVHVACAGGELVSLPAAGGAATRSLVLDRDLRDVAVYAGTLFVSRFRTAEVLELDASGNVAHRTIPPGTASFSPAAAWRLVAADDGLYLVHQRAFDGIVHTTSGYYGSSAGTCSGAIVHSTLTHWVPGDELQAGPVIPSATLPVDVAVSPFGAVAVVSAGNAKIYHAPIVVAVHETGGSCNGTAAYSSDVIAGGIEPIAIAYTPDGALIVQSREPAAIVVGWDERIDLASDSVADTGHAVFHANAGGGVACASCHLEGGDDARTWQFDLTGARRTQALRGGILGTEPFHWSGDEADFSRLAHDIFERRMGGPLLTRDQLTATASWVDHIPVLAKAPGDADAIARGQALFESTRTGCTTCHRGPKLTNAAIVDVGTGGAFKVPRLVGVVEHAPFLHDGRAATLSDRFQVGGSNHGNTAQLTAAEIADLVAFLGSL